MHLKSFLCQVDEKVKLFFGNLLFGQHSLENQVCLYITIHHTLHLYKLLQDENILLPQKMITPNLSAVTGICRRAIRG